MATDKISVGILGLGRSGWGIHAKGLEDLPEQFTVAAVADPMPERQQEAREKFGCETYDTPEQLIAESDVELVTIATPSHTHAALAQQALAAGKHVVVEKPMAGSVAEIDELIAASEKSGTIITAFQNQRLDPSFLAVKDVFDSGRIGEPVLIRRTVHRFQRRNDWQTLRGHGGGELPNTALHFLDQLLTLVPVEMPVELLADLRQLNSAGDAEDHVKLTIRPESGPVLDLESSMVVAAPQESWFVVGTKGTISGTPGELTVKWTDLDALPDLEANPNTPEGRAYGNGETYEWQTETIDVPSPNQRTQGYYSKLYDTIRNGAELFVTPASVRRVAEVVDRARAQSNFA
ncbi:MAG TPA: Gfo/Idh/MocA family oxidoreductase [Candidatus Avipropionibacterium avicola]|uniref:Gfo/Idh/MocA family oxidoreductase n=1 Tax=Candidatus Avipropionibacterium avicola TaxID=2840701 RepID=A0A9D1KL16_9ACTN|nr:Gfo/Idh/MocA family oxidoreductase [Candidatus Avipropionibacterium avicola]